MTSATSVTPSRPEPVGATKPVQADIRIIAATNQDLERAVRDKRFRSDLYYRLNVVTIPVPPLRDRREDIPVLARHFLKKFERELGLGELLDRMPAGLFQMVGETGWQLSHGERSRLFMARALLQGSPLVILDESFGALDPETLRRCMDVALARADTLLVIAHP